MYVSLTSLWRSVGPTYLRLALLMVMENGLAYRIRWKETPYRIHASVNLVSLEEVFCEK